MGLRLRTLVICRQLIIKEVFFNQIIFLLLLNMLNKLFCLIDTFDEAWTHFLVVCVSQSTLLEHHQWSYKYRYTIHWSVYYTTSLSLIFLWKMFFGRNRFVFTRANKLIRFQKVEMEKSLKRSFCSAVCTNCTTN